MDGAVACVMMVSTLAVLASCHQVCLIGSEYDPRSGMPPRWFLPYKEPCKCTAIRLGGMNIPASSYLQGAAYYLDQLIVTEDPEEIQSLFDCKGKCLIAGKLGLEDGTINDDRISASSSHNGFPASEGRLNNNNGYWRPEYLGNYGVSWIEVDLVESTVVSGVITQGNTLLYRVKQYKVAYKNESLSDYEHVTTTNGDTKIFDGNLDDSHTPVTNIFDQNIVATVVRIVPVGWYQEPCMRFELLGCHI